MHTQTEHMPKRGKFITFEGGEGSGKSTQSKLLAQSLKTVLLRLDSDIVWTREPGGSKGAEDIRALLVQGDSQRWRPTTEAMLMFAARDDHYHKTIKPALDQGKWVICDRFTDSTMAYQGYGKGVSFSFLKHLETYVLDHVKPDRTYLLDISADQGLQRAEQRMAQSHNATVSIENRFEMLGRDFHKTVRDGFLEIAKAEPKRICVIDACQDIQVIAGHILNDIRNWSKDAGVELCSI